MVYFCVFGDFIVFKINLFIYYFEFTAKKLIQSNSWPSLFLCKEIALSVIFSLRKFLEALLQLFIFFKGVIRYLIGASILYTKCLARTVFCFWPYLKFN